ncbi:CLUMA_CG003208, isoform A [Clunio marinus]|uniref:CLUMA_CG003208, isoform A n=1 Tax=Clunio marinus TaxID=568069 RepID=A0A1J1HSL7_9DIPT|nr:CLUMA_CG003208, isoform A [Clunio marinus]
MESFISELTQRKSEEFNKLRMNIKLNKVQNEITSIELQTSIEEIYNCLDTHDGERLMIEIDKCLQKTDCKLPRYVLCETSEYASANGNAELFTILQTFIKMTDENFYKSNYMYFKSLSLELDWRSGKNIDQVLEEFEINYRKSFSDQTLLKHMTKLCNVVMQDAVEKRGESTVIKIKHRIEKISEETKDYQLLFILWRKLFESFWFSDQQLASELVEKHVQLRKVLCKQSTVLSFIYLRHNNIELVHQLIQIFLRFNMTKQVEVLVRMLFEFECWRKNLNAVLQIVQLCLKLDIQLSEEENKKFLDLLLKRPRDVEADEEKKRMAEKIPIQKYQFKF